MNIEEQHLKNKICRTKEKVEEQKQNNKNLRTRTEEQKLNKKI